VLLELLDRGDRKFWSEHPISADMVAGVLVVALTVVVLDQIIRHRLRPTHTPTNHPVDPHSSSGWGGVGSPRSRKTPGRSAISVTPTSRPPNTTEVTESCAIPPVTSFNLCP
jgi:hypothetical protein